MKTSIVRQFIFLGILACILSVLLWIETGRDSQQSHQSSSRSITVTKSPKKNASVAAAFSYKGKEGVDALTLLKEITIVEQTESGLVTAIGGKKADEKRREFWSFYVNEKMAAVGPAEYITKDTDSIEWKIETY